MRLQGIVHRKCALIGKQNPSHCNIIEPNDRRVWRIGMSELRNGNDAKKMIDRKGRRQENRWRQNSAVIARWNKGGEGIRMLINQERRRGVLLTK